MYLPFSACIWIALVCGLLFGSFLNVCIVRLPRHQSIAVPRSHCQSCASPIRALDNIPVASWIWLRGRCRTCGSRISIQYPLVEAAMSLLWIGCVIQTGATWQTLTNAVACFLLLGLAVMDAQTMLLPDAFTLTGIGLVFVLRVCEPGISDRVHAAWVTLVDAAIGAAILLAISGLYWLVRRRSGMGMGDVKLLAMIAAFLGLPLALFGFVAGVLAAALFAAILLVRRKAGGYDRIPFGAFLAAGAILAIFAGQPVIHWYVGLLR
jgi:leader peptidase (prepilin peptidase) / N-methyltransferase